MTTSLTKPSRLNLRVLSRLYRYFSVIFLSHPEKLNLWPSDEEVAVTAINKAMKGAEYLP